MILSNAKRNGDSWENKQRERISWMISACLSFRLSLLRLSSAKACTLTKSFRSLCRSCKAYSERDSTTIGGSTHFEFHRLFLFSLLFTPCRRRPRFQVQSLQERCTPSCFPFQAPILAHQYDKILFFPNGHFADILNNPLYDYGWYERGTRFICLRVGAC